MYVILMFVTNADGCYDMFFRWCIPLSVRVVTVEFLHCFCLDATDVVAVTPRRIVLWLDFITTRGDSMHNVSFFMSLT